MIFETFRSAWWMMREPRILLLSAATTIGFGFALSVLVPTAEPAAPLSSPAISAVVVLLIARSWCGLSIAATALKVLRRDRSAPTIVGVSVVPAICALVVTVPPMAPIVVGAFLTLLGQPLIALLGFALMTAGAFWAAAWSQAGMLIIDGRAGLMEAGEASGVMTRGCRSEIILMWFLVGAGVAAVTWLDARLGAFMGAFSLGPPIAAAVHLAMRVASDAFATCCVAGLYYELDKTE